MQHSLEMRNPAAARFRRVAKNQSGGDGRAGGAEHHGKNPAKIRDRMGPGDQLIAQHVSAGKQRAKNDSDAAGAEPHQCSTGKKLVLLMTDLEVLLDFGSGVGRGVFYWRRWVGTAIGFHFSKFKLSDVGANVYRVGARQSETGYLENILSMLAMADRVAKTGE